MAGGVACGDQARAGLPFLREILLAIAVELGRAHLAMRRQPALDRRAALAIGLRRTVGPRLHGAAETQEIELCILAADAAEPLGRIGGLDREPGIDAADQRLDVAKACQQL